MAALEIDARDEAAGVPRTLAPWARKVVNSSADNPRDVSAITATALDDDDIVKGKERERGSRCDYRFMTSANGKCLAGVNQGPGDPTVR